MVCIEKFFMLHEMGVIISILSCLFFWRHNISIKFYYADKSASKFPISQVQIFLMADIMLCEYIFSIQ